MFAALDQTEHQFYNLLNTKVKWRMILTVVMAIFAIAFWSLKKNSGHQSGREPVTSRYRCDALPTELWMPLTLGAGRFSGFIAQLVERRTGIARSWVQAPLKYWIFFRLLYAIAKIAITTARIILHVISYPQFRYDLFQKHHSNTTSINYCDQGRSVKLRA